MANPGTISNTPTLRAAALHERVYFGWHGAWGIKIGKTVDVQRRAEELRMLPILSITGGLDEEKRQHKMWASFRTHGEWFWPGDALLFYLNSHVVGGDCRVECGNRDTALRLLVQIYQCRHDVGYVAA